MHEISVIAKDLLILSGFVKHTKRLLATSGKEPAFYIDQ